MWGGLGGGNDNKYCRGQGGEGGLPTGLRESTGYHIFSNILTLSSLSYLLANMCIHNLD